MPTISGRSRTSSLGWLGFPNAPLNRYLASQFSRPFGSERNFLADPTFEAVFGWTKSKYTLAELSGKLLHPSLVQSMDSPPPNYREYRFDKRQHPYAHQVASWECLSAIPKKSLIVTSGTGSGKTECFMVPIIDQLIRVKEAEGKRLMGVRALFLYPLNALINSQRERLGAWTGKFEGDIRFCLYNGLTPEKEPAGRDPRDLSEVKDRRTLRNDPPPILVTNTTMLEYMLVRSSDAPIIEASKGKLEWIVLDEAHSYIGSQAAEMALLLRRVMNAFEVDPANVRFVATSATIGDIHGPIGARLRKFLADMAGVEPEKIQLIAGERDIPDIAQSASNSLGLRELLAIDEGSEVSTDRYRSLCANETAASLRGLFTRTDKPPVATLNEIVAMLGHSKGSASLSQQQQALEWLDLLTGTRDKDETPYLPLRGHFFHQSLFGIWACCDPSCALRAGTALDDPAWPFGKVYFEPRSHCECGSPVFELVTCNDCGTVYLRAEEEKGVLLDPDVGVEEEEFELEVEADEAEVAEETIPKPPARRFSMLLVNRPMKGTGHLHINRATKQIAEGPNANTITVLAHEQTDDAIACPACGAKESASPPMMRKSIVGVQFSLTELLPALLEFASDAEKPADKPYRGRRLLSFTDSRQGTARLAAMLQQSSERQKIRGFIYHTTIQKTAANKTKRAEELKNRIAGLERSLATPNLPKDLLSTITPMLAEARAELAACEKKSSISYQDLIQSLTQQGPDFRRILDQYIDHSREVFGSANGSTELAGLMIVRELGRRPKRQNNLETIGMVSVQYPALDSVTSVPYLFAENGYGLQDWKDFLKIALDYFARGGGSLDYKDAWRHWLGLPASRSWIVEQRQPIVEKNQRRWPSARRSKTGTLVRLLSHALHENIDTSLGQDRIDSVLAEAWEVVKNILTLQDNGYSLSLYKLSFAPIERAWICPVTRKFLDTTLRGMTPYVPISIPETGLEAACVDIPVYDRPYGDTADELERLKRAREWIASSDQISRLREEGLWTDLNDKVIELAPYIRTVEHSAQQQAYLLDSFEKDFKKGNLNILSCSTTMEMGIDIGGVQIVAMNNVPPHPANYLQRAGRAGRRQETRSVSMTLCRANPHDQNAFLNTRWAFDTPLPPPFVSLDSPIIVQRHVNAFLLSSFLRTIAEDDLSKLNCGWFFIEGEGALYKKYNSWCGTLCPISDKLLEKGLHSLVAGSILSKSGIDSILDSSKALMKKISDAWLAEWDSLLAQEFLLQPCKSDEPALKAIQYQKKRMTDEYLLRELTAKGFLPSHGFPTSIASFNNITVADMKRQAAKRGLIGSRIENPYLRMELPSRDIVTAIREYAPGSDVVINGLVYRSAGITLNWHIPANQDEAREVQAIRFAWRCRKCGANGTTLSLQVASSCSECAAQISKEDIVPYIEPAGFAVDFYEEPGNNLAQHNFVPYERPWISAPGEWQALAGGALGRFRVSAEGKVFYHSSGPSGYGYAICLKCGRAHAMLAANKLPMKFRPKKSHRKLRGNKTEISCEGSLNNWAIKGSLFLGHESNTDIAEIQIKDSDGAWLQDADTALAISVALRNSLAELLGVQTAELGSDIREALSPDGKVCQSIFIFDRYAAGYSTTLSRNIDAALNLAAKRMKCPRDCESSCPSCLMDYEQRFRSGHLDRHLGLSILSGRWLHTLGAYADANQ